MTRIREFIGVQPTTVSTGGSRSNLGASVCLLAPGPIQDLEGVKQIQVVFAEPTLVFGSPLDEVQLREGNSLLWSVTAANADDPIRGSLKWPLPPLKSKQRVQLLLRPQGSDVGDSAHVTLIGASQETINHTQTLIQSNIDNPSEYLKVIDQSLRDHQYSLSYSLLWESSTNMPSGIHELRSFALKGCVD